MPSSGPLRAVGVSVQSTGLLTIWKVSTFVPGWKKEALVVCTEYTSCVWSHRVPEIRCPFRNTWPTSSTLTRRSSEGLKNRPGRSNWISKVAETSELLLVVTHRDFPGCPRSSWTWQGSPGAPVPTYAGETLGSGAHGIPLAPERRWIVSNAQAVRGVPAARTAVNTNATAGGTKRR